MQLQVSLVVVPCPTLAGAATQMAVEAVKDSDDGDGCFNREWFRRMRQSLAISCILIFWYEEMSLLRLTYKLRKSATQLP
jgi:hypothetical protein